MNSILTLGESLIRLTPESGNRLLNSNLLNISYGGAEANVAINLSRLGHSVSYATKLPRDNDLSEACLSQLRSSGVNCENILTGEGRLGAYFLELGSGLVPSKVLYDRKYSAISLMSEIEWDTNQLFKNVSLFHITGITAALSPKWQSMVVELIKEAKKKDIQISFDMNFRSKMWTYQEAIPVYNKILPYVDILSATSRDAETFFNIGKDEDYLFEMSKKFKNLKYIFGTNRVNHTPNAFEINGYLYDCLNQIKVDSKVYQLNLIKDRVGSGDSFTAGILDGVINGSRLSDTVEFAMASAVMQHYTYGDTNFYVRSEIEQFMNNKENVMR